MIAEFLRAEIDSSRFAPQLLPFMEAVGSQRGELMQPDLEDEAQNQRRARILGGYRGWRQGTALFAGFPEIRRWERATIAGDDFKGFFYSAAPEWVEFSKGTCSPLVAAQRITSGELALTDIGLAHISAIAARLDAGDMFPPILAVGSTTGSLAVIFEGASRITAHLMVNGTEPTEIIYGVAGIGPLTQRRWFPRDRQLG